MCCVSPSVPMVADSLVSLKLRNTKTTFLTVGIRHPVTYQLISLPPREKCQLPNHTLTFLAAENLIIPPEPMRNKASQEMCLLGLQSFKCHQSCGKRGAEPGIVLRRLHANNKSPLRAHKPTWRRAANHKTGSWPPLMALMRTR